MQKDFSLHPGEYLVTWLRLCSDSRTYSLQLEVREARQPGSLTREGGIDKAQMKNGNGAQMFTLWRQLRSGIKERYPFKEGLACQPGKRTTMEKGFQHMRVLAMLDVI